MSRYFSFVGASGTRQRLFRSALTLSGVGENPTPPLSLLPNCARIPASLSRNFQRPDTPLDKKMPIWYNITQRRVVNTHRLGSGGFGKVQVKASRLRPFRDSPPKRIREGPSALLAVWQAPRKRPSRTDSLRKLEGKNPSFFFAVVPSQTARNQEGPTTIGGEQERVSLFFAFAFPPFALSAISQYSSPAK